MRVCPMLILRGLNDYEKEIFIFVFLLYNVGNVFVQRLLLLMIQL